MIGTKIHACSFLFISSIKPCIWFAIHWRNDLTFKSFTSVSRKCAQFLSIFLLFLLAKKKKTIQRLFASLEIDPDSERSMFLGNTVYTFVFFSLFLLQLFGGNIRKIIIVVIFNEEFRNGSCLTRSAQRSSVLLNRSNR